MHAQSCARARVHDVFLCDYVYHFVNNCSGDLGCLEDHYITKASGKCVTLRIWSEHDAVARCGFAMQSLKESMLWDEEVSQI